MKRKIGIGLLTLCISACGAFDKSKSNTTSGGSTSSGTSTGTTGGGGSAGNGNDTGATVRFIGRVDPNASGGTLMAWSGTTVVTRFQGSSITASFSVGQATSTGQASQFDVIIDGTAQEKPLVIDPSVTSYNITATGAGPHTLMLVKRTEAGDGQVIFGGFSGATLLPTPAPATRLVEFVGDSISAGYGDMSSDPTSCPPLAGNLNLVADPNLENVWTAYGPLTANALKADWSVVAWSGKGVYMNRDGTTTNTVPSLFPLIDPTNAASTYDFSRQADVVVVNLGTNDFGVVDASGNLQVPTQTAFVNAYHQFVQQIRAKYPKAQIILCSGPMLTTQVAANSPNGMSPAATEDQYVQAVVSAANQAGDKNVSYFAFTPNPGQFGCDYHPNNAYQSMMASALTAQIQKLTGWK